MIHAELVRALARDAEMETSDAEDLPLFGSEAEALAAAQAIALADIAEQLHMANVIAMSQVAMPDGSLPFVHLVSDPVGSAGVVINNHVLEVLGL